MKNIKYDHIDKNKIINLCQFLVVAAAVQNNIIIEKEKLNKEKVFPHNQSVCIYKYFLIWLTRIISTMKCKQKSATRKVHLIFFIVTKCGQSNFPFKFKFIQMILKCLMEHFWCCCCLILNIILLILFIIADSCFFYLSKVWCGCMQHEISIFIDCPSFFAAFAERNVYVQQQLVSQSCPRV